MLKIQRPRKITCRTIRGSTDTRCNVRCPSQASRACHNVTSGNNFHRKTTDLTCSTNPHSKPSLRIDLREHEWWAQKYDILPTHPNHCNKPDKPDQKDLAKYEITQTQKWTNWCTRRTSFGASCPDARASGTEPATEDRPHVVSACR